MRRCSLDARMAGGVILAGLMMIWELFKKILFSDVDSLVILLNSLNFEKITPVNFHPRRISVMWIILCWTFEVSASIWPIWPKYNFYPVFIIGVCFSISGAVLSALVHGGLAAGGDCMCKWKLGGN